MNARLPVVGSTAATTSFCHARLDGPGGLVLHFDGNGKVTAGNGTLLAPQPNAFSLPAQGITDRLALEEPEVQALLDNPEFGGSFEDLRRSDCPGSTPTCRKACYVEGLNRAQPELYALYQENAVAIRQILADRYLANEWAMLVAHWITTNAPGGFRWHVSGDLFSLEYAEWIADVVRESPTVRHWIYTRSFEYLGPLAEVSTNHDEHRGCLRRDGGNLSLNLSCDADNIHEARKASLDFGAAQTREGDRGFRTDFFPLRLCYLTVDGIVPSSLKADDVIFPDYALRPKSVASLQESAFWQDLSQFQRGLVCPVDAHGKSERIRCGPCDRCLK